MPRLKKLNAHKKKIILLMSITFVLIGFVPQLSFRIIRDLNDPYTVEPLALKSEDGTYISSFIYAPKGEKNHGGIIISHRYWGDKMIMQPISIELVRRGFTVISIDLRAHGASGGQFIRSELINDVKAAVDYLELELSYITQIGLIGHSLGAIASAELARAYPDKINATVVIGSLSFNPSGISNLLFAFGRYEPFLFEEEILNALRLYTGEQNVTIGQLYYGDFVGGNNTMAFVGNFFDHLLEIIDPTVMYQVVQWFEQVFNGAPAEDIVLTEWFLEFFSLLSQLGIISLNFILIVYLSNNLFKKNSAQQEKETDKGPKSSVKRLISYFTLLIMGFTITFFFFALSIPRITEYLNTASSILVISLVAATGTFLFYPFLIMSSEGKFSFKIYFLKIKMMYSTLFKSSMVFGIASALLLILSLPMFWNLPYQSVIIIGEKFGFLIGLILISFPLLFIKEFYFRIIQGKLKKSKIYKEYIKTVLAGILMDNLIIFMIFSVSWINFLYMPVNLLYLSIWIRFSIIQNILVTWIYIYSERNILGSTIFSSIIYAWLSVIIFPSYGFI